MQLSMGEVAAILGTSCDTPERIAQGFSIDSRTIRPGQVFFAIRGAHLDGHRFVRQALERGASGAVVEHFFREELDPASARRCWPSLIRPRRCNSWRGRCGRSGLGTS
jgi:UDP-N-acetylmuramoyl-tripeptide--D-alanyl-D-alanine ligase